MSEITAAKALLQRLGFHGVEYLFANAGTDFAPIIEAYEAAGEEARTRFPEPLVIPHETAAVAMAHSYFLVTGRPQAVMVHVNVGLANCVMGLLNAQSDNVPVIMLAGRTPITEYQRHGSRMTPIQYGQEMRDQTAMVREAVKWDYELRYGEQMVDAVDRAVAVAMSHPFGPVFLALPREPLAETITGGRQPDDPRCQQPAHAGTSDPATVARVAEILLASKAPLIICQRGDPEGRLGASLAEFSASFGIPVVEPFPIRNVMSASHPQHLGYQLGDHLSHADAVLVIDSPVPWIQRHTQPREGATLIHVGADPLFSHLPMRNHPIDIALQADPSEAIEAIARVMRERDPAPHRNLEQTDMKAKPNATRTDWKNMAEQSPVPPAFIAHALSKHLNANALVFSELGPPPGPARVSGPNQWFTPPFSGGLGWGLPAALGAKLAHPERLVISCVGDGSYQFANPVACHQVAERFGLPILTIVLNNSAWNATRRAALNMFPDGAASRQDKPTMTDLSPSPDFLLIAQASRAWTARVETGGDLQTVLEEAIQVVSNERRQVLIEVTTAKTDGF